MKGKLNLILIIFVLIYFSSCKSFGKPPCQDKCRICQTTVYKLKFERKADCGKSHCKTIVKI